MSDNSLAHYGKKGMKWGQRLKARDESIKTARANQKERKTELKTLKKTKATSVAGKEYLDTKLKDKKLEVKNHDDAKLAKKSTTGEKIFKTARFAAVLALTVVAADAGLDFLESEVNPEIEKVNKGIDNLYVNDELREARR